VTSEATNIYDPRNGLLAAYRTLFEQWRLAFEIGAANRALGHGPIGVAALARRILAFWRGAAASADASHRGDAEPQFSQMNGD
jgi:hypothetical protein